MRGLLVRRQHLTIMPKDAILFLLEQWLSGRATAAEKQKLLDLINNPDHSSEVHSLLESQIAGKYYSLTWDEKHLDEMVGRIVKTEENSKSVKLVSWPRRISVAAAVLIFISGASYFLLHNNKRLPAAPAQPVVINNAFADKVPNSGRAVLTLANGKNILLDSALNGKIAVENGTNIVKLADGQIAYHTNSGKELLAENTEYNTLSTPRGAQYFLLLPDGSKVWLNAASTIRYPVQFTGDARKVEITGEAYFEVAKNTKAFFVGLPNGADIQVLGTHFNVNAYNDDGEIKTSLLEGAVKVRSKTDSVIMRPGEQAQISGNGQDDIHTIRDADMEQVMAWRNGLISFRGATIKGIMKQLERWYDVDVEYRGNPSDRIFTGEAESNLSLSEMIRILEANQIHLKVEGRKIIVI